MFPKIGGNPQNGWFIMETPLKMMDGLGVPLFSIGVIITHHIIGIFHNPGDFQGIGDQILPQLIWGL